MFNLPQLIPGDKVEIIAPASRCADTHIATLQDTLTSWQLSCVVDDAIFGDDLVCANTDAMRFKLLNNALYNPETKAIICARGGYGSMRLLPHLCHLTPPNHAKLFIGMSDITALNLFLQQNWHWSVVHGALSPHVFTADSTQALKALIFGEINKIEFAGMALNEIARQEAIVQSTLIGGNLCLLQASIGTSWQVNAQDKIIFIEEVAERGYRIDRMLEQLRQVGIFNKACAIVFGDCIGGTEPDGSSLVMEVIKRFALECTIPVIKIAGVGHDKINFPLPLGTKTQLTLGRRIQLTCCRGGGRSFK